MPDLRYGLFKQLHFIAEIAPGQDAVVTIQHWQSKTTKTAVYVRVHDGVEFDRHFARSPEQHARIEQSFEIARAQFGDHLLSDEAAADEVARRTGQNPRWCHATDCGAIVPFAAPQCADGHPVNHVNAGTYLMGASRRPAITVITGGRK